MFHHYAKLVGPAGIISIVLITFIAFTASSLFTLIKIQEDSMSPALSNGQVALVLRGSGRIRPGDIAVYHSPTTGKLVVKRCVLNSDVEPRIEHGWLITPWGRWYLSEEQWKRLDEAQPEGSLFMVGDNQFKSFDSRDYGFVPRKNFIGRVLNWGNND